MFSGPEANLNQVQIDDCGLKEMPKLKYVKHTLKVLRLNNNQIAAVERDYFENMAKLSIVEIAGNLLTEMPNFIPLCNVLNTLRMETNFLTDLGK